MIMNPRTIARRWGSPLILAIAALCTVCLLGAVVSLAGCAAAGVPTPQTFNERLAAGYATATASVQAVDVLLKAKRISPGEASDALAKLDQAKAGLDAARSLGGTNPLAAQDRLTATLLALEALHAYLSSKGAS